MHLGLFGLNTAACADPATAVDVARRAELLGFESLWVGEHVVLPDPRVPPSPLGPRQPVVDPLIVLSYLAAVTSRVRLGTGIIILPQRNPVVLAKELASLDLVSAGRLLFGLGVGYLEPEFAAVGVPFADRGRRADEYLEAMQALWSSEAPAFSGRYASFAGVDAHPRPVQQPLPVLVGGASAPAYRRAVERAHGWYGFGLDPEATAASLDALADAGRRYQRPEALGRLEITITPPVNVGRDQRTAYADLGVDRLALVLPHRLGADELGPWLDEQAP